MKNCQANALNQERKPRTNKRGPHVAPRHYGRNLANTYVHNRVCYRPSLALGAHRACLPRASSPRAAGAWTHSAARLLPPVPAGDAADGLGAPTPAAAAGSPDQLGRYAATAPAPPAGGASVGRMASPLAAEGAQRHTGGDAASGQGARAAAAAGAHADDGVLGLGLGVRVGEAQHVAHLVSDGRLEVVAVPAG